MGVKPYINQREQKNNKFKRVFLNQMKYKMFLLSFMFLIIPLKM